MADDLTELRDLIEMVAPGFDVNQLIRFFDYNDGLAGSLAARRTTLVRHFGEASVITRFVPAFKRVMLAAMREQAVRQPLAGSEALKVYLHAKLAHEPIEQVLVLYLDAAHKLIAEVVLAHGSVSQIDIHPRAIMVQALETGAASLILVHNHPSGDPKPSEADVRLTRDILQIGKKLGVNVQDHIVVGRQGVESMRELGLL